MSHMYIEHMKSVLQVWASRWSSSFEWGNLLYILIYQISSMQLYSLMFITLQFEKREPDDDCPYLLAISLTGKKYVICGCLGMNVAIKILF